MTDEEYLRASWWRPFHDRWERIRFSDEPHVTYSLSEAVAMQVAEDRARYNFVRARSRMHGGLLLSPEDYDAPNMGDRVAEMYEAGEK